MRVPKSNTKERNPVCNKLLFFTCCAGSRFLCEIMFLLVFCYRKKDCSAAGQLFPQAFVHVNFKWLLCSLLTLCTTEFVLEALFFWFVHPRRVSLPLPLPLPLPRPLLLPLELLCASPLPLPLPLPLPIHYHHHLLFGGLRILFLAKKLGKGVSSMLIHTTSFAL